MLSMQIMGKSVINFSFIKVFYRFLGGKSFKCRSGWFSFNENTLKNFQKVSRPTIDFLETRKILNLFKLLEWQNSNNIRDFSIIFVLIDTLQFSPRYVLI